MVAWKAGVFAGALLAGVMTPALADPTRHLGGGFIELLVTGRDPTQARAAYQPPAARVPSPTVPLGEPVWVAPRRERQAAIDPSPVLPEGPRIRSTLDPRFLPQVVAYDGPHRPGTVIIDTADKFLYLVEGGGQARRYGVGVGRPGFGWRGTKTITRKAEWPDWRPPPAMLRRRPDLPRYMPGGPENPMGARGLYLGSSLYRIHGTNEPETIGRAVSSGCFRMRNEDVIDIYNRVRVGTRVVVM